MRRLASVCQLLRQSPAKLRQCASCGQPSVRCFDGTAVSFAGSLYQLPQVVSYSGSMYSPSPRRRPAALAGICAGRTPEPSQPSHAGASNVAPCVTSALPGLAMPKVAPALGDNTHRRVGPMLCRPLRLATVLHQRSTRRAWPPPYGRLMSAACAGQHMELRL